jgi:type IV pilus assembly protein PilV
MSGARNARAGGMTLIEVMMSMAILLLGMLGMMALQIWGLNSNQGARATTTAAQLARELATGLERLPFNDPRLAKTILFGGLLQSNGSAPSSGYTSFAGVPGVRGDDVIERMASGPVYQRRWTVRTTQTAGQDSVKLIAVSVIYRERRLPRPKEIVVYTANVNRQLLATNIGAY